MLPLGGSPRTPRGPTGRMTGCATGEWGPQAGGGPGGQLGAFLTMGSGSFGELLASSSSTKAEGPVAHSVSAREIAAYTSEPTEPKARRPPAARTRDSCKRTLHNETKHGKTRPGGGGRSCALQRGPQGPWPGRSITGRCRSRGRGG